MDTFSSNMKLCGIDEAGRGPVIGPMVMCAVTINSDDEFKLKSMGAKDSKLLSPSQREKLFDMILDLVVSHDIRIFSPQEIDTAVLSSKSNLNWLEADAATKMIIKSKANKAYVDCPSNNVKAYVEYLKKDLSGKFKGELIAAHKADAKYPVVSAASIIAKVTRDREIEKIKKEVGVDFGSGYPADPMTVDFLAKNWQKYDIFRKSWVSWSRLADKKKQKSLGDY